MKKSFTMLELIFVVVVLGILAAIAIPKFFGVAQHAHEANLVSFVKTLNRTTGEDLWGLSISNGHHGSIKIYSSILEHINVPEELNTTDINLSNCGTGIYAPVAYATRETAGKNYVILCKDGTDITAPYFKLIRLEDNKTLVSRD
jgi:prepilin-type N-terminal cleavage/methylation domain-containing protein